MEHDPIFRNLVEKVLSKPGLEKMNLNMDKNKDRTPEVTLIESLLEIFPKVFAVIEISIKKNWDKCFEGLKEVMLQSPKSYVETMLTLCYIENEGTIDVYDRFLNVFALVNYVTNMYFTATGADFYELSSLSLTIHYENVLRQDFEERGGWKCLNKYIQDKKYVRCFHDCEKYNFVTDDFPKKLKVKIRDSFSLPWIILNAEMESRFHRVVDCLTNEVMSSVKSPLNDLNSPKLNEEQSISKEAERSSFSTANILEVSGTVVSEKSDLFAFCQYKVEDLEETLQYLLGVFELLDEMQDT
ncbi:uncharacterized protein TNCT_472641 [Trichonephila clavata]|uniref:Uncharacterized protein n=1 Tax=Trichonephila clavata TaxID=2740835 RepID=A0A8X6FF83_TRICU|nr:uncharacterized protein TNCT_472641 [Trichonephila clavata]